MLHLVPQTTKDGVFRDVNYNIVWLA